MLIMPKLKVDMTIRARVWEIVERYFNTNGFEDKIIYHFSKGRSESIETFASMVWDLFIKEFPSESDMYIKHMEQALINHNIDSPSSKLRELVINELCIQLGEFYEILKKGLN